MSNIGVQVVIDPSGAVSGGRTATTSLDKIETQADMTTASVNKTNAAITATGPAAQNMSKQVDSSSASMKKFNGFVGAAGFQVSDMAIQLGMGANAAMVFGIQGGQLLGFLSPIAGALATVSGILIGQFTGGMYAGAEATRELDDALVRTNEEINELTKTQARFAQATLSESLNEDAKALVLAQEETKILKEEYEAFLKQREEFEKNPPAFGGGFIEEFIGLADVGDKFRESEQNVEELQGRIDSTIDTMQKYGQVLEGNKLKEDDNADAIRRRTDSVTSLSQNLIVLQTRISGNNREAAIQEAVFRSGAEAGSDYAAQIALLSGQQYDLQQQLSATNDAVSEFDQDGAYLEKLERQADAIGLNAREQAMLRAEYALSEKATETQIQQARQLAGALYDATAEQKLQDDITRTFRNTVEGLNPSVDNYVIRMAALTEAHTRGYISAQHLSAEMVKVQQSFSPDSITFAESFNLQFQQTVEGAQNMEASLGEIYGNMFGTLSSSIGQATADMILFGTSGEDAARQVAQAVAGQLISSLVELGVQYALNAALGETIAAASLAATSASAAATGVAWATPAALASLATLGTNSAPATAAVTGTVAAAQGVALAGSAIPSFAEGGLAYGPGTGTSDSFTANLSNGEFVMPQRETARNLGTLQSMRAGNDVTSGGDERKIVIQNYTTGRIDSAQTYTTADEVRVIIREETPNIVSAEFNDEYSQTNKAVQQQYSINRRF